MELVQIHFKPIANVTFSREELELLLDLSTNHYDGVCREFSNERSIGGRPGLIRGMMNCERHDPHYLHQLTFRQLDTLAKILEMGIYLPDKKRAAQSITLGCAIRQTLISLNESVPTPTTPKA